MTSYTSVFRYFFASLLLFNFGLNADRASAISWNISGPGTSQVILDGDSVTFTYELDVRRTYGVFVWDISGGIFEPGPIAYDWTYTGTHDFAQANTQFGVDSELQLLARDPNAPRSPNFSYSGHIAGTVLNYSKLHLWVSGSNDDRTDFLRGTLTLRAVPVPPSVLLLGTTVVLLGLLAGKRRRQLIPVRSRR